MSSSWPMERNLPSIAIGYLWSLDVFARSWIQGACTRDHLRASSSSMAGDGVMEGKMGGLQVRTSSAGLDEPSPWLSKPYASWLHVLELKLWLLTLVSLKDGWMVQHSTALQSLLDVPLAKRSLEPKLGKIGLFLQNVIISDIYALSLVWREGSKSW